MKLHSPLRDSVLIMIITYHENVTSNKYIISLLHYTVKSSKLIPTFQPKNKIKYFANADPQNLDGPIHFKRLKFIL
jgi:hypothetical protein